MKGARGLLISITGGKDLTLYEVDEAATRIREEVDQDANIIVGATFDESLVGIIRVSVVATGIDHVAMQAAKQPETRIADITSKLRADSARLQERLERTLPGGAPAAAAPTQQAPAVAQAPVQSRASLEQVAAAAVAAALQDPIEDVQIRPIQQQKPSLFMEPVMQEPEPQEVPAAFIPPQAERPTARPAPRMPRIDEFPVPAQNQIRASRGEAAEEHPEKRRMGLLQRLASVGLGRQVDEQPQEEPARAATPQTVDRLPPVPRPAPQQANRPDPVSEYAKRPAPMPSAPMGQGHQGLDVHGRSAPAVHKPVDDDQLDIPAFLRRQAN
jgi:cell division protein FtsZ